MEHESLVSPALAGGFFTTSTTWEAPAILMKVQIGGERDLHYGQPLTTEDTSQWINTASSIPFQDALYIVSQKVSSKMEVFFSFILTFTGLHSCSLRIVLKINSFCINLALHKWPLGSNTMNKASGGDEIPAELFSNPKR